MLGKRGCRPHSNQKLENPSTFKTRKKSNCTPLISRRVYTFRKNKTYLKERIIDSLRIFEDSSFPGKKYSEEEEG